RPRRPRRRHDPYARRPGKGQGDRRQGPAQGREPGRGRRRRRGHPGRRAPRRGQGRAPAGRDAALTRHRDEGWRVHEADRAQHDEVERMVHDAEAHADEAHRLRELADARNHAESLAYATERSLKEHRDKLDEAEASTIEGRIMELKQAVEGDDLSEIRSKTEA